MFLVLGRALALALRGHREVVLENLALRQQLRALQRTSRRRPTLETSDRLFWITLARVWPNWRTALVFAQPDTAVRWHRDWLRREWLDHVVILNERHLRRVLASYLHYYHLSRTHLSLQKDTPAHRPLAESTTGLIVATPEVGGLHQRYDRRAA